MCMPAWFIAAVLPLPPRPEIGSAKGKDAIRRTQIVEDLEKQLGPIDEARYENARWWRNINRIMSVVGILIIIAIVSCLDLCPREYLTNPALDRSGCSGRQMKLRGTHDLYIL